MTQELKALEIPSAFKNADWDKEYVEATYNYMSEDWQELTDEQWNLFVDKFNSAENQEYLADNRYDEEALIHSVIDIIDELLGNVIK